MVNLESIQVYGGTPYTNPADYPYEMLAEHKTKCGYCDEDLLEDEDDYCKECQIQHDEYMKDWRIKHGL